MNEMDSRRAQAGHFEAKNSNLNNRFMKMERDGQARLEPSGPVARRTARRLAKETEAQRQRASDVEREREALSVVRRVALLGDHEGITPQLFIESLDILKSTGLTDEQILAVPVSQIPSLAAPEITIFHP